MGKPKTTKKPRMGFDNPKSPGSRKLKKTALKKAERREGKAKSKKKLTESFTNISERSGISKFITSISTKNYAQAHKYLHGVIEKKIQTRIANSLNKPLF